MKLYQLQDLNLPKHTDMAAGMRTGLGRHLDIPFKKLAMTNPKALVWKMYSV
jgi:hypothetical protein